MYGRPDMTFLTCVPLIVLSRHVSAAIGITLFVANFFYDIDTCCERQYFDRNDLPTVKCALIHRGIYIISQLHITCCYSYSQRMVASDWFSVRHYTVQLCCIYEFTSRMRMVRMS